MNVLVTCGPSYEPIDEVRRITNFSTGELGVMLAEGLARSGCRVTCLKGAAATYRDPAAGCQLERFTTNEHLVALLESRRGEVGAVFHVAALCDFKMLQALDASGRPAPAGKIPSRGGGLTLQLGPAKKVIAELRRLFPQACLVGWKYELEGTPETALAQAWKQVEENRTDACVLNGRAYGSGFAVCLKPDEVVPLADKAAVVDWLAAWIQRQRPRGP